MTFPVCQILNIVFCEFCTQFSRMREIFERFFPIFLQNPGMICSQFFNTQVLFQSRKSTEFPLIFVITNHSQTPFSARKRTQNYSQKGPVLLLLFCPGNTPWQNAERQRSARKKTTLPHFVSRLYNRDNSRKEVCSMTQTPDSTHRPEAIR